MAAFERQLISVIWSCQVDKQVHIFICTLHKILSRHKLVLKRSSNACLHTFVVYNIRHQMETCGGFSLMWVDLLRIFMNFYRSMV